MYMYMYMNTKMYYTLNNVIIVHYHCLSTIQYGLQLRKHFHMYVYGMYMECTHVP